MSKSVIETLKLILNDCKILDEFNGIHVDYMNAKTDELGLFSSGAHKVGEDIIGNCIYRINFQLYSMLFSTLDLNRLSNNQMLTALAYFLNNLSEIDIEEMTDDKRSLKGVIIRISCGNSIQFDYPTGRINDGVRYQTQITVDYKLFNE